MVEIETILCPTDSTAESEEALRYAVALARVYEARLMLCRCGQEAPAGDDELTHLFEDALAPHCGMTDFAHLDWVGFEVNGDAPGVRLAREAGARRADLIVMRSRRGRYGATLLGSTAEAVCRTAPCSVLVTHPRERERVGRSAGDIELRRVLVAHDFSDRSEIALQYGASFARRFGAELHLLHILPEPERGAPELAWVSGTAQGLYHSSVRRLLESVPGELGCGLRPAVLTGRPYEKILSYAEEHEIDLICLGADGVGHTRHALFGSNVDRVLRQAPCPVLVARQFKPATAEPARPELAAAAASS